MLHRVNFMRCFFLYLAQTYISKVCFLFQLWNTFHQVDLVIPTCKKTIEDLGVGYLDLYLIHWPMAYKVHFNYFVFAYYFSTVLVDMKSVTFGFVVNPFLV